MYGPLQIPEKEILYQKISSDFTLYSHTPVNLTYKFLSFTNPGVLHNNSFQKAAISIAPLVHSINSYESKVRPGFFSSDYGT